MFRDFQTPRYAGFWMRFLAYLVDALLMSAVFFPLGFGLGLTIGASGVDANSRHVNLGSNGVSIVVGWLYYSLLESSSWQGTLGKKLLGMRVMDLNGNRISFGRATVDTSARSCQQ